MPVVSGVSPAVADTAGGGGFVTVTVDNSTGCTGITAGGVAFTSFSIVDGTHVKGVPGAHAQGAVAVVVTNATGPSVTGGTPLEYWTPLQITNVSEYLDANKSVTLGLAANVTSILGLVSGNAWTNPANNATCLQLTPSVFGTMPSFRATGTQFARLAGAVVVTGTGMSAFAVAKWTATTAGGVGNPGNEPLTILSDEGAGDGGFGASAGVLRANYYTGANVTVDRGAGLNDGNARLIGTTMDTATNTKIFVGATQQGTTNAGAAMTALQYTSFGCGYPSADGWNGDLGALVIVLGVIAGGDLTKLYAWAQQRWGAL